MSYLYGRIKILALVFALGLLWIQQGVAADPPAPVKMAVGYSIEPYILKPGSGIIGDTITESFRYSGLDVEFLFVTNHDALALYNAGEVDSVTVVKAGMVEGFYSQPLAVFHNRAIFLADNHFTVTDIEHLKNFRILAFSDAHNYLGPIFKGVVDDAVSYREIGSQQEQVKALFEGEADVIIADETIFGFYRKKLQNSAPMDARWRREISMGFAFPDNIYCAAFRTSELQAAFDRGFEHLKSSGRYQQIKDTYLGLLQHY